jgi:protein involved in temperature-dependent protein secretion
MLTPRVKLGGRWYRLHLHVSKEDEAKIGRGKGWKALVEENSGIGIGRKWLIKSAACSLGDDCHCDAIAVEQRKIPKRKKVV